ncbi:MAG: hypothetical protein ACPL5I_12340 [Thermodesulfobacteriota bacterium]
MGKIKIAGLRQLTNLAQITIAPFPLAAYHLDFILSPLATNGINLEFFAAQGISSESMGLILAVKKSHIAAALGILQEKKKIWPAGEISHQEGVAMLSLFPHGKQALVISNFISALQEKGIRLLATNLSLSAISALMEEIYIPEALSSLSDYFYLPG